MAKNKNKEFYAGQKFDVSYPVGQSGRVKDKLRVMSVVDGYVMARWNGKTPFVQSVADFKKLVETLKVD